ncbi:hypothetical protein GQR60_15655 [Labilibaculum sp. A4]|uniref:hypothetical protein n=1 Tax=Labilibaculum euxinus TaxID=2686357 RepID=UPI000F627063|nr:hypothetical protein [Labilibaculum euxinus]MDQ1771873.1 hypothetical protein [Labilibaculum euxinus]MWN77778.1 hypothetical protein [Labilibaculum euxinus]
MSIGNAIKFMKNVDLDSSFRKSLYKLNGIMEFRKFQIAEDLEFSDAEFEDAFNHLHSECQFAEQADKFFHVKHLFELIICDTK